MQTVHLRVCDAATGKPLAVRLRITDEHGKYYPPLGHRAECPTGKDRAVGGDLRLGHRTFAYIDGSCEVPLPPGRLKVEITHGFAYRPLRREVDLRPGQLALRLTMERLCDPAAEGWLSGDARCHALTPHAALLEAAAEDVAVVQLLVLQDPPPAGALPDLLAFSGQHVALASPGHAVVVNTLNRHPLHGSLALLHAHRVVFPLRLGDVGTPDDWPLAAWCDQCHRKRGLVVWVDDPDTRPELRPGEPLADLVLGRIDAVEIDSFEDSPFDRLHDWYDYLACGLRVSLVGGSGKRSNGVPLGAMRTFAHVGSSDAPAHVAWIEAVRQGHTFISNGPLLSLDVNGARPGQVVSVDATKRVIVRAEARSAVPFDWLEVLLNGAVVATSSAKRDEAMAHATLDCELVANEGAWVAARCVGSTLLVQDPAPQRVFAHTSPVHVEVAGRPFRPAPAAVERLRRPLERLLDWARTKADCTDDTRRDQLAAVFSDALAALGSPTED